MLKIHFGHTTNVNFPLHLLLLTEEVNCGNFDTYNFIFSPFSLPAQVTVQTGCFVPC